MTEPSLSPDTSPDATELRRRAVHLVEFAAAIERSLVMTLADDVDAPPTGREGRMCRALLERNLHQLHRAADDLRSTALGFRTRADELEARVERAA